MKLSKLVLDWFNDWWQSRFDRCREENGSKLWIIILRSCKIIPPDVKEGTKVFITRAEKLRDESGKQ